MAVLKAICGRDGGSIYPLDQTPCLLGRASDCHIREIFLGFSTVSRHHAVIEQRDGKFYVKDTGSHNGTWVNSLRITKRKRLRDRDRLSIGGVVLVFLKEPPGPTDFSYVLDSEGESTISRTIDVRFPDQWKHAEGDARLGAMVDMLAALGGCLDVEEVMHRALYSLLQIFEEAEEAFVCLGVPGANPPKLTAVLNRNSTKNQRIHLSRTVVDLAVRSKKAVLSEDACKDARFDGSDSIQALPIRSLMCVPILDAEGESGGILQLNSLNPERPFCEADLRVLTAVCGLLSVVVQYSQLHEAALKNQALEQELMVARLIHQNLLPNGSPILPNYTFHQFYRPARQLGGDYFDYLPLPDGRLAVVVADACGKGIAAAVLILIVSGELKSSLAGRLSPAAALERVNARLLGAECDNRFVTLAMIIVDTKSGEFEVLNAGHFDPIVRRRHGAAELVGADIRRLPLGIEAAVSYPSATGKLEPGESVVMFSDGLTDAMASAEKCYGLPRLIEAVESTEHTDARCLVGRIVENLEAFVGSQPQFDDMCLVCVHRHSS